MAINSSNSSDTSAQVAQLIQASQTAAASNDKKTAAADLAQAKSVLAANPGAFDQDTLSKANNEITLLNGDFTQGLSIDGMTQDQHMASFVSQVQALGITVSGSTASGSSASGTFAKLGSNSSATSSTGLNTIGSSSGVSSSTTSGFGSSVSNSASKTASVSSNTSSSASSNSGVLASVVQSKIIGDFDAITNAAGSTNPSKVASLDAAVTDLQKQLTSLFGAGNIPADVQTKYSALMALRDKAVAGDTTVSASLTSAKNSLADSIAQNGGGDTSYDWGDTSVLPDGTAAPTSASASGSSASSGSSSTSSASSSSGQTVDYTASGYTATNSITSVVQNKVLNDFQKVRDAVTAGNATAGYGVDSAVTDTLTQLNSLFGKGSLPAAVQSAYASLSALRDKWVGGDTSVGSALNDANNKLADAIAANGGGGSAFAWGDASVDAKGNAVSTSGSSSSSSSASTASTSSNHDWKDAGVSFSQSDIANAVSASPPDVSKLGDYLSSLGDKIKDKLVGKNSKKLLDDLKGALQATPLDKQDVATAFAKFSSDGIKNSANDDQKKAYNAVLDGVLQAIGESGNSSVDKRGKSYVGDKYTASI